MALTFHQALEHAAMLATQALPATLHARLSCAVSLVKDGHVFQDDAGVWTVSSTRVPGRTYTVNGTCPCDDLQFNHPPRDLCKHRLGMFLSQRVQTLMQQPPEPVVPDLIEPWPDNDVPEEEEPMDQPAPQPEDVAKCDNFTEAPASVNVRVTVAGREVQWTLRDSDEARLAIRLAALLARYPVPAPAPQPASQGTDFCHVHQVAMRQTTKDGKSWLSHYDQAAGKWCKGRG